MRPHSGAAHLVAALREVGARCVFGVPGTQTVPLFEALRKSPIRTVLGTSEAAAAFMAGGWARVTGEPGVCLTIPGPGFAWSLPGIAEARLDSVPLLALTGAPPDVPAGRRFRQQELDQAAIASPLVKRVLTARSPSEVGRMVREAFATATAGEPGPVLLQLSADSLREEIAETSVAPEPDRRPEGRSDLEELCRRVGSARRPVILLGQGTVPDAALARRLVDRLVAPVLTTPSARGLIPEDHPLALAFDSVAGSVTAVNELLAGADLILVLGAKLGHNGTAGFALRIPAAPLVHVDASAEVLGANYPAALSVVARAGEVLQSLLEFNPGPSAWSPEEIAVWRSRVRTPDAPPLEPRVAGSLSRDAAGFFTGLRRALPRDAILVLDSGLHQLLARRHFPVLDAWGLMLPSDLQSMGFGIPTALGVRLAAPHRPVLALVGDGGFTMTGFEVLSAVREGVDLVVIVFADGELGQIRLHQLTDYGAAHAVRVGSLGFAALAEALGAGYAEAGEDIEAAVRRALEIGGVTLIEVPVGDSPAIRSAVLRVRVREGVRRAIGPRLSRGLKRWWKRGG